MTKFEQPYKDLIAGGVTFYAALGNHDEPGQKNYKAFNMGGDRFYAFRASTAKHGRDVGEGAQFFALDSTYLDKTQLDWLEKQLSGAPKDEWKIAFFHHPLYSSARKHGSSLDLRKVLEPMFVKYGVNVVLARTRPRLRAGEAAAGDLPLRLGRGRLAAQGRPAARAAPSPRSASTPTTTSC